jgi:hypothetical protein
LKIRRHELPLVDAPATGGKPVRGFRIVKQIFLNYFRVSIISRTFSRKHYGGFQRF